MDAKFELYPQEEPGFDGVNYLTIIKVGNSYSYAFRMYDGEKGFIPKFEGEEIIAFSETDPKLIAKNLIPVA